MACILSLFWYDAVRCLYFISSLNLSVVSARDCRVCITCRKLSPCRSLSGVMSVYDLCVLASLKAVHQTIAAYVWALLTYYRTPNTSALRLRFFFFFFWHSLSKFHCFCIIEYFVSRAHYFDLSLHSPLALVAPLTRYINPTYLFGFEITESLYTPHHTFMFCSNIHACSALFCEIWVSRDCIVEWGNRNTIVQSL